MGAAGRGRGKQPLNYKQRKDRTENLEQELGLLLARGGSRTDRMNGLLSLLADQAAQEPDPSRPKEPSRNHLETLQSITKILLESPDLDVQRLNPAWVRRTAHKPEELTDVECLAVVRIVKALSLYTPKRVKNSSGGTSPPTSNPASMIKVVLLSNHMLRYTGYSQFTRRFAPAPSVASLHPVSLGAAAL
ncbi:hypothetical protein EC957_000107 [Mortierella hygrophila]|uniref:Uncharacterized protein n=1 Tax=Mortierella hygrophila TaxID=979708 RepID=A0A9P6FJ72_9FUNG|nr:hypothetical protein EC957_000107 [Mortierella hygrophila]